MEEFPLKACFLKLSYTKTIHDLKGSQLFKKMLQVEVVSCIARMNVVNRYIDNTSKVNEAAVCMLVGNEIILMMCAVHGLTFRVEDKVLALDINDDDDGGMLVKLVTSSSTTNYICFSVELDGCLIRN